MMATYKRNKSGGSQSEGASNSASPTSSIALSNPSSSQGTNNNAPKYGTLVPNRIFVGGISSNTTEAELSQLFSKYGNVKATKIIADRAGVSKGYGFVTFDSEEEVKLLFQDANNIILKERRLNIAPAVKKQIDVFVGQPVNRSFDTSSPPPTTPSLFFHNGVPYTYHNGMAFFPPSAHQPTLAAIPQSDGSMYPSYGPTQNAAPAPYGTPLLMPAPQMFVPPTNYSYQPMPMTNGAPPQYIYTNSGTSNGGSGSPDSPAMAGPLSAHTHISYSQQFVPQEAFYSQPIYIYSYPANEYETQDPQGNLDDCSSTLSSPRSDMSDRSSSNRSPANIPRLSHLRLARNSSEHSRPNSAATSSGGTPPASQAPDSGSQVPVVSWQNIQDRDERLLYIRDGRRAFLPPPPPQTPPQMLLYQPPPYPPRVENTRSATQRQNSRGRAKPVILANSIPFIPKFPACFINNNNPLAMNNNNDKMPEAGVSNGGGGRLLKVNGRGRGVGRGNYRSITPPPNPNPNPSLSSPPQMMQQVQFVANSAPPRWCNNAPNQIKRLVGPKRQNGPSNMNMTVSIRSNKKGGQECVEIDAGGGGDTPALMAANSSDISSKMQSLALGGSS